MNLKKNLKASVIPGAGTAKGSTAVPAGSSLQASGLSAAVRPPQPVKGGAGTQNLTAAARPPLPVNGGAGTQTLTAAVRPPMPVNGGAGTQNLTAAVRPPQPVNGGAGTQTLTAVVRPPMPVNGQPPASAAQSGAQAETARPVYTPSDTLTAAGQTLAAMEANKPEAYQGSYDDRIQTLIDSLLNRQPSQYDAAADPLYQQYAQQYRRGGELAMKDAMAQSAGLTGGYGNTYAQLAGQQGYQQHLEGLNAMLPQLQQAAYQMYLNEGNTMLSHLDMLNDADRSAYNRYRDSVGDWHRQLDYMQGKYNNMSREEYERFLNEQQNWEDDRAYRYQQQQDAAAQAWQEQQFAYQQQQDAAAQAWQEQQFAYQQQQDAAAQAWQEQQFAYQQQQDQLNWDWLREQFAYQQQQDALSRQRSSGSSGGGSKKKPQNAAPSGGGKPKLPPATLGDTSTGYNGRDPVKAGSVANGHDATRYLRQ